LIDDEEDIVHFSTSGGGPGIQIESIKDNLEYHLTTIKSSPGIQSIIIINCLND